MSRRIAICAALAVIGMLSLTLMTPTANAANVIQIGEGRGFGAEYPYNEWFNYDRWRSATLYTDFAIKEAGGGPGRIARLEWQTCPDNRVRNHFAHRPANSKRTRIWLALSPRPNWPIRRDRQNPRHFSNLIDPSGPEPFELENLQLVYEGPMFTENLGFDDWYGIDLDTPYLYFEGHLAVIIAREYTPERNRERPRGYNINDERGCWQFTRIAGPEDDETNTRFSTMQWWGWGRFNPDDGNEWPWIRDNRPNLRIHLQQGIEESFPGCVMEDVDNDGIIDVNRRLLRTGFLYDEKELRFTLEDFSNPYIRFRASPGNEVSFSFKIIGPAPHDDVIYEAIDPETGSTEIVYRSETSDLITYYMDLSNGKLPAANVKDGKVVNGALDLSNIEGGSYRVRADFNSDGFTQAWNKEFIVTYDNDVAVNEIVSPFSKDLNFKYPRTSPVAVEVKYQNVGLEPVGKFKARTWIRRDAKDSEIIYESEEIWTAESPDQMLKTGELIRVDFPPFINTEKVDNYIVCSEVELLSADDEGKTNDLFCQIFEIQYDLQVAARTILEPEDRSLLYVDRPVTPEGVFINLGISDQDNVPVRMIIWHENSGTEVYNVLTFVNSLPNGNQPIAVLFDDFTPKIAGEYRACIRVAYGNNEDPVPEDDEFCIRFTVEDQLRGTYTVGRGGDFETIKGAIDALYLRGVGGPVNFEFIDSEYLEGNPNSIAACNLTTRIIGMSAENPVTWRPHVTRSTTPGGIHITMQSLHGIGFRFGQSHPLDDPDINRNGIIFVFNTKENTKANGYMTFDGGKYKALRFSLLTDSKQRAAFYFGEGSSNYTVKNCIIDGAATSTPSYAVDLPQQVHLVSTNFINEPDRRQRFDDEDNPFIETYSAGIVIRNTQPWYSALERNSFDGLALDTMNVLNNRIENNDIHNFGYGVVSLGTGDLFVDGSDPRFVRFYNRNQHISGNRIWDVARAGIYLGFTEQSFVRGNRIWAVGDAVGHQGDAAGIMAGNDGRYNVVDVTIAENEISDVSSPVYAAGILVSQDRNVLDHPSGFLVSEPPASSVNQSFNNSIWDIRRAGRGATIAGIHYRTSRDREADDPMFLPRLGEFNTQNDFIANNTVVISDGLRDGDGAIFGIGIQNAQHAQVLNNAIAVNGPANATSFIHAGLFYQGVTPSMEGGINSDRNAFWTPNASFAFMAEITSSSELIEMGTNEQFVTMGQWRALTNDDNNSVYGDFLQDLRFEGEGARVMRVKTNPTPLASILNNRGFRLPDEIVTDVEGNLRGEADQRFDIGADEFNGRLHVSDIEAVEIVSPRQYRRVSGSFSDAEYVMTKAPIMVDALFRNGGSLPQSGVKVTARIFLESRVSSAALNQPARRGGLPVAEQEMLIDISNGETQDVHFDFSDDFNPQTFRDLGWTTPDMFATMHNNVTPRYIIEIETVSDENIANNKETKELRFYLLKSEHRLMLSLTGTLFSVDDRFESINNLNDAAAYLNSDTLHAALVDMNLHYDDHDFDVLERRSWEPYGVDYACYRTIIWSHDMNAFSRLERNNLRSFLAGGKAGAKKNLLVASQDAPRLHRGAGVLADQDFVNLLLRAQYVNPPGTPSTPDYNNKPVVGVNVHRTTQEILRNTTFDNGIVADVNPLPSLIDIYSDGRTDGTAVEAYRYLITDEGAAADKMGISVDAQTHNVIYYAVDWRHFGRLNGQIDESGAHRVIRASFDEFENNKGNVLPVELAGFSAYKYNSNLVKVAWETRSERNSARFDVERRLLGDENFVKLGEQVAQGFSTQPVGYEYDDNFNLRSDAIYEYRLRMVDLDGRFEYSRTVAVDMRAALPDAIWLGAATPNPANDMAMIEYRVSEGQEVTLELYDIRGVRVKEVWSGFAAAGSYVQDLRVSDLAGGVYTYVLRAGDRRLSRTLRVLR